MLMRICCFLAPPELGELGKPGSLARRLALGRPLALLCGLVRGIIRLIIVNYIRVAVPMTGIRAPGPPRPGLIVRGFCKIVRYIDRTLYLTVVAAVSL